MNRRRLPLRPLNEDSAAPAFVGAGIATLCAVALTIGILPADLLPRAAHNAALAVVLVTLCAGVVVLVRPFLDRRTLATMHAPVDADDRARVERLAAPLASRVGLDPPAVLIGEGVQANAGVRPSRGGIAPSPSSAWPAPPVRPSRGGIALVVTTGLLATRDDSALAGVIAHELAHLVRRDRATRAALLLPFAVVACALYTAEQSPLTTAPHVPLFLLCVLVVVSLGIFAGCRRQEYAADVRAVRLQGDSSPTLRSLTLCAAEEPRRTGARRLIAMLGTLVSVHPLIHRRLARIERLPTTHAVPPHRSLTLT